MATKSVNVFYLIKIANIFVVIYNGMGIECMLTTTPVKNNQLVRITVSFLRVFLLNFINIYNYI